MIQLISRLHPQYTVLEIQATGVLLFHMMQLIYRLHRQYTIQRIWPKGVLLFHRIQMKCPRHLHLALAHQQYTQHQRPHSPILTTIYLPSHALFTKGLKLLLTGHMRFWQQAALGRRRQTLRGGLIPKRRYPCPDVNRNALQHGKFHLTEHRCLRQQAALGRRRQTLRGGFDPEETLPVSGLESQRAAA